MEIYYLRSKNYFGAYKYYFLCPKKVFIGSENIYKH